MIYLDDLDDLDDEDQADDAFTWLDCDNPDCNCHPRPIQTVHLPAEDVE